MAPAVVTLYGREGCKLCDEARARIEAMREGGAELELREVDIDRDDELLARYLELIPVVAVNGDVVSELVLDEDALITRLDTVKA